jgi:hypothetical protein
MGQGFKKERMLVGSNQQWPNYLGKQLEHNELTT